METHTIVLRKLAASKMDARVPRNHVCKRDFTLPVPSAKLDFTKKTFPT
jgi:hypothetical protein